MGAVHSGTSVLGRYAQVMGRSSVDGIRPHMAGGPAAAAATSVAEGGRSSAATAGAAGTASSPTHRRRAASSRSPTAATAARKAASSGQGLVQGLSGPGGKVGSVFQSSTAGFVSSVLGHVGMAHNPKRSPPVCISGNK